MNRRIVVVVLVLAVLAAAWRFDLLGWLDLAAVTARWDELRAAQAAHPLAAAAVFFLIYVAVAGTSLPGAAVLTLVGGALFGLLTGFVLVSFASSVGATLAMLLSRTLLGEWVQKRFASQLAAINTGISRDGGFYLFSLRLIPLFPFFVVNLVLGLTRMPVRQFYLVSQVGMIPGTLVYVFAGTEFGKALSASAADGFDLGTIVTPGLLAAFTLLGLLPWVARGIMGVLAARRAYRGHRKPKRFDANLIVIGAGSGGLIAALIAATIKAKVFLIERHLMGGDCLNTGCVPSKALLASAKVAQQMRDAHRFGITSVQPTVDFKAVMARVKGVIAHIEPKDSVARYTSLGVDCVHGNGVLVDPWTVEVDGRRITARSIVLASGARPAVPPIPGLDSVAFLTSDSVWSLDALPPQLVVLGGGPIGCELAQAFARLGAQVAIVDMVDRLLPREDPEVCEHIERKLASEGVRVLTGHGAVGVTPVASGSAVEGAKRAAGTLRLKGADGEIDVPFSHLLVAVGRKPNNEHLGLEALGIRTQRNGAVEVDDYMTTAVPNIYACGDLVGPYQFTHMASHQAWYAAVNSLVRGFWRFRADYRVVPWATFTDPEVAQVGLNERAAKEAGVAYEVTHFGFDDLDRALAEGESEGWLKVLTRPGSDEILGVTIVGPHAGELIAEAVLAMTHRFGLVKLMGAIHVYPTLMEAHKAAAGAYRRVRAPQQALAFAGRLHAFMRGA